MVWKRLDIPFLEVFFPKTTNKEFKEKLLEI